MQRDHSLKRLPDCPAACQGRDDLVGDLGAGGFAGGRFVGQFAQVIVERCRARDAAMMRLLSIIIIADIGANDLESYLASLMERAEAVAGRVEDPSETQMYAEENLSLWFSSILNEARKIGQLRQS